MILKCTVFIFPTGMNINHSLKYNFMSQRDMCEIQCIRYSPRNIAVSSVGEQEHLGMDFSSTEE